MKITSATDFGIVANVWSDRHFRTEAKVLVIDSKGKSTKVRGLSVGGRVIDKWVRTKNLHMLRAKWLIESDRERTCLLFASKEEAAERAIRISEWASQ